MRSIARFHCRRKFAIAIATIALAASAAANDKVVSRIAFGSCAKQDRPQPIWDAVVATQPQLFIFLGDNIYGDSDDMDVLRAKYALLGNQPGYQLLKRMCPVVATWDDHDYGADDAGADFPKKRESQQVFLDFFDAPKDDPRRSHEGVYSAEVHGPSGKRVQVILLDARYFRSPLKAGYQEGEPGEGLRGKYIGNTDSSATVLGETQWRWLSEQLKVPAEVRIIGSSYQALANEHGWEKWGNFPLERQRFLRVIRESRAQGVVIISGDRHMSEMSRMNADDKDGVNYPLFDVTSSSLNSPSGNFSKAKVRFVNEINNLRVGAPFFEVNFGTIMIDWEQPDPIIRLQVRDEQGGVVLQQRVLLSQLKPAR